MPRKHQISEEVMDVLKRSTITPTTLKLPEQLSRDLYAKVAKVITLAGGKWNRGQGLHTFEDDPRTVLGMAIEEGGIADKKKDLQQFFTPPALARQMVEELELNIWQGVSLLEPSCGRGNLLKAAKEAGFPKDQMDAVEIDQKQLDKAVKDGHVNKISARCADFLSLTPHEYYDYVLMNPPFTGGQDMDHVTHAFKFLKRGGRLVAIMFPTAKTGTTKKHKAFHELLAPYAPYWETIGSGTFASSGTPVATVMLVVTKE